MPLPKRRIKQDVKFVKSGKLIYDSDDELTFNHIDLLYEYCISNKRKLMNVWYLYVTWRGDNIPKRNHIIYIGFLCDFDDDWIIEKLKSYKHPILNGKVLS